MARKHGERFCFPRACGSAAAVLSVAGSFLISAPTAPSFSAWAQTEPAAPPAIPSVISMSPGEIMTMPVSEIKRAAVGDPTIIDVTVISSSELMLQAKRAGTSTLLFWDSTGQHAARVEVAERTPEAIEAQLKGILNELNLPGVQVKRDQGAVFLVGEVATADDVARLEQVLTSFFKGQVTNLVGVTPPPQPSKAPPPLVSLAVQVIELNRTDLERLGIKWSEALSLTEPEATDLTFKNDALLHWGTSLTRSKLQASLSALVEKKKARLLAEPKLVTASGKEASSFIGVEVPIIKATEVGTGTASVSASIEFRQTGVLLKMTPTVLEDQKIRTTMEAEVSSVDNSVGLNVPVGSQTILVPGFSVRKASTDLTMTSGETILIAGLLQSEDANTVSQVPALGSMPVIGRLFRSPENKTTRRELVIAVTPEILAEKGMESDRHLAVEQALASAEVVASVEDPRLRYALTVQDRIAGSLRYPIREKESGIAGMVKLRLHLFADGTLGRAMVAQSSGIEALDMEALKVAEARSPYPPFPSQLTEKELWLEVPIIFRP